MIDPRQKILGAAHDLLSEGGENALTIRAVAERASVQAPTIYRLFVDKAGLVEATAEYGLQLYVDSKKRSVRRPDPIEQLRASWDRHVEFCLANPAIFAVLTRKKEAEHSPATAAGIENLQELIVDIAAKGKLAIPVPIATALVRACANGTVMTLIGSAHPEDLKDLSATARELVVSAIAGKSEVSEETDVARAAASTLQALLPTSTVLSLGERTLMSELLGRLISSPNDQVR
ncbi:TetR/AcrR family transcriptional regulator [Novosphingobium aquimarinum]|uniref:TetR/AcrR family transcriptional regulator n=1 Tax=Novosphingobium aquimarinum TaxID=2682494 RepID=UPI0012EBB3B8|nr:TetR/AcrR family transcriptional regulator [Novosphingobium aquimarinum]